MDVTRVVDDALSSDDVQSVIFPTFQQIVAKSPCGNRVSDIQLCFRSFCIGLATAQQTRDGSLTPETLIAGVKYVISREPYRISEIPMQLEESSDQSMDEFFDDTVRTIENWCWSNEPGD